MPYKFLRTDNRMSNRLFQNQINLMRDATDRMIGALDEDGVIIACSEPLRNGERVLGLPDLASAGTSFANDEYTFRAVSGQRDRIFAFAAGADDIAATAAGMLAAAFAGARKLYDDRYDRYSFVRGILLDNLLPDEIAQRAKEFRFQVPEKRAVFIIRLPGSDYADHGKEVLESLFPDRQKDFIVRMSDRDLALVKLWRPDSPSEARTELAVGISDTFGSELFTQPSIGISNWFDSITGLRDAAREAATALDVCQTFGFERRIAAFDRLGLARLIYRMPDALCRRYLDEVFGGAVIDSLDREMIETIQCFFENSLNVSETARKLFIHRNTLVYRLDKIRKMTGLDIRDFENAISFRLGIMIMRYLERKNSGRGQGGNA